MSCSMPSTKTFSVCLGTIALMYSVKHNISPLAKKLFCAILCSVTQPSRQMNRERKIRAWKNQQEFGATLRHDHFWLLSFIPFKRKPFEWESGWKLWKHSLSVLLLFCAATTVARSKWEICGDVVFWAFFSVKWKKYIVSNTTIDILLDLLWSPKPTSLSLSNLPFNAFVSKSDKDQ